MNRAFRWLWLGQLISNLGTQCSLYGIGLWSFGRQGHLLDFAAVAFVVQLSKVLVLPMLGKRLTHWPRREVMLLANGLGALCTVVLAALLLVWGQGQLLLWLPLLAFAAMAEAALVLCFASLIPVMVPEPKALARANGLFVSSDGLVLSVAPFAGSWLVASAGLPSVLLLDGLSFGVAMGCVLLAWSPQLQTAAQKARAPAAPIPIRLRQLLRHPARKSLLLQGGGMALVYAATEVIFPAWVISGPGQARLGWALVLGALGYALGFQIWSQWAWRRPRAMLLLSLILQSLVLMGAGLVVFQNWLLLWYSGLLVFSLALPVALSALHSLWQQQGSAEQLSQLLAQRYRIEWGARLMAFAGSAALVDGVLRPAFAWPHWPDWLISSLGQGPGRPLAAGLGALGWLLLLTVLSQERGRLRSSPSDA